MIIKNKENKQLSELLSENGIMLEKPCGGNGTCGKCKVRAKGALSPISDAEKRLLTEEELASSVRLACKTYATGDFEIEYDADCYKKEKDDYSLKQEPCVAAVDLGTTMIEARFFSARDFRLIKQGKIKNPQCEFGADVISRIMFAKDDEKRELLQKALQNAIHELEGKLSGSVEAYVITGNTTMLHFFSGLDAASIAVYPFKTQSLFGTWRGNVFLPHCVGAYIGADAVTAVLSSGMLDDDAPSLIVDIGTNGEMALYDGEKLFFASTSAGPALEGASISCGMTAENGAIKSVSEDGGYETVGNEKARGICASGLIDAVCFMLKTGVVTKDGYLEENFELTEGGVFISPQDIRNLQLAKAAIKAGIDTLLSQSGIKLSSLKNLYVAGALGSSANIDNCIKIGLLPEIDKKKIILLGNAALNGASMILKNRDLCKKTKEIAKMAQYVDLSLSDEFVKAYIDSMSF